MEKLYGAVETGGTKCICLAASSPAEILSQTQFPTGRPQETTEAIAAFFHHVEETCGREIERVGLASFGPLDLNPASPTYGRILATPKLDWKEWNLLGELQRRLSKPVVLDTDVNGAALAEYLWGAAQGLNTFIYLTIGTGIGGGGMTEGRLMHGLLHPEMGHILIPHDREADPFPGICPFHADCFEGLASGPALQARWGVTASQLPAGHIAWDLEVRYIAAALHSLICTLSPQRIILGGGVMKQAFLFKRIRQAAQVSLAGYVSSAMIFEHMDEYIVPPGLGPQAGVMGALALAITGGHVTPDAAAP